MRRDAATTAARLLATLLCSLLLPPVAAHADGPALWAVAGERNTVYLFGSVHLLRPGEFRMEGPLQRAFDAADAVYLEVDMDDLSPLEVAGATAALAVDPAGRSLDELMGEDAATAHERAAEAGLDLALLAPTEPWFAALAVVSMSLASEGYTSADGVEQQLLAGAAAAGKEVRGLETLEEQLSALDSLELSLQREFLLKSLEDAARPGEALREFLAAWRSGDEEALARQLQEEFAGVPSLYRSLLVERNRRWLEQLLDLLDDDGDFLVVVGALHLVGPDGIPAMLAARGYEPVRR